MTLPLSHGLQGKCTQVRDLIANCVVDTDWNRFEAELRKTNQYAPFDTAGPPKNPYSKYDVGEPDFGD